MAFRTRDFSPLLFAFAFALATLTGIGSHASAKERYALVIANKAYTHTAAVAFADRDADAIETALRNVWAVKRRNIRRENNITSSDLKYIFGTKNAEGILSSMVGGGDSELIVYYAGHGSKAKGKPYLLGVDTRPSQLEITGYSLDVLLSRLARFQRKHLPDGRVTLILESCFSGRSQAGELITGTSAPAFGPPITISKRLQEQQSRLVVMAAAQGDQYAVWDTEYRQSVFTDALVSGLHGEADRADFGGDGNGKITRGELNRFVSRRIRRRLKSVRPGSSQSPEFIGGRMDEVLVDTASTSRHWREQFRRTHGEKLKAGLILSKPAVATIESYLATCLYCPKRKELLTALDDLDRKNVSCELEKPIAERLLASGTAREIESYTATCLCCSRKQDLNRRLASLATGAPDNSRKVAIATPPRVAPPSPAAGCDNLLATAAVGEECLKPGQSFRYCADCPEMVVVPADSFLMGSPKGEKGHQSDEEGPSGKPLPVTIARPFAVGKFEVTRGQFGRFVKATGHDAGKSCWTYDGGWKDREGKTWRDPGFSQDNSHPVVCVSWKDAKAYVEWLNSKVSGTPYRLLSESEWEYAARAGTTGPFSLPGKISTSKANYNGKFTYGGSARGEYRKKTVPVDSFEANAFGLYQVHGNVWEWVEDCYEDSYKKAPTDGSAVRSTTCSQRVLRGGSWYDTRGYLRSAYRNGNSSGNRLSGVGFRVSRTLTP